MHGTIDSFDFFWLVCVMKKFAAGFFRWFLAGGWQERKGKRKEERCEQVKKEKKKRTKKKGLSGILILHVASIVYQHYQPILLNWEARVPRIACVLGSTQSQGFGV